MSMKQPGRPGDMVGLMIEELDVSVTAAARALGVSRKALSKLINDPNAAITPEMAVRLEEVFGSTAGNWLRMQASFDAVMIQKRRTQITRTLHRDSLPREEAVAAVV